MKTITELNAKWWYRLAKVLYVIIFILSAAIYCTAIYVEYEPVFDNHQSYIECANRDRFILSESGITLYSEWMSSEDKGKASELCGAKPPVRNAEGMITMTQKEFNSRYQKLEPSFWDSMEKRDISQYRLVRVDTERDWFWTITASVIGFFVGLLVFEILRRIFYYVILGRVFPPKS